MSVFQEQQASSTGKLRTIFDACSAVRWHYLGLLTLVLASGPAWGGICKENGETCRASRSCCGSNGKDGVCVIAANERFGYCCTPSGPEVCDGADNDCSGTIDDGAAASSCDDDNQCSIDSCDLGACAHTALSCDDGNGCTNDTCDPATGCAHQNDCGDGVCDLSCENASTCPADCIGAGSCQSGQYSCVGATGQIGENSCNGDFACYLRPGNVGDNSCNGYSVCNGSNSGNVGDNSCNGFGACFGISVNVGDNSCDGDNACFQSSSAVGSGSCNAFNACCTNATDRGDNACNTFCECADGGCQGGCP